MRPMLTAPRDGTPVEVQLATGRTSIAWWLPRYGWTDGEVSRLPVEGWRPWDGSL